MNHPLTIIYIYSNYLKKNETNIIFVRKIRSINAQI